MCCLWRRRVRRQHTCDHSPASTRHIPRQIARHILVQPTTHHAPTCHGTCHATYHATYYGTYYGHVSSYYILVCMCADTRIYTGDD